MIPDLARVLDSVYLVDLPSRSTDDLRSMRAECTDIENGVSFVRRVAQGRLDLMLAETRRRETGSGGDAAGLVADLPDLLAGDHPVVGSGRVTGDLEPPDEVVVPLTGELDAAVGPGVMTDLTGLDDESLSDAVTALRDFESRLSEARRDIHIVVDSINDELAQRYRAGETPAGV